MNLVIFLCWVGPVPYLELLWVGPVKKPPCIWCCELFNETRNKDTQDHKIGLVFYFKLRINHHTIFVHQFFGDLEFCLIMSCRCRQRLPPRPPPPADPAQYMLIGSPVHGGELITSFHKNLSKSILTNRKENFLTIYVFWRLQGERRQLSRFMWTPCILILYRQKNRCLQLIII